MKDFEKNMEQTPMLPFDIAPKKEPERQVEIPKSVTGVGFEQPLEKKPTKKKLVEEDSAPTFAPKKIECDGQTYFFDGNRFFDEYFCVLSGIDLKKVSAQYYGDVDYKTMKQNQMLSYIKELNKVGLSYLQKKVILFGMEKFKESKRFLSYVLPMYTSCCRAMNTPKDAVEKAEELLPLVDASVPLYTSLAAACCDLKDYEKAVKYAKIAYAKQGGGQGYKTELSLVFMRIKRETGVEFFER